jgi:hypothetical protein
MRTPWSPLHVASLSKVAFMVQARLEPGAPRVPRKPPRRREQPRVVPRVQAEVVVAMQAQLLARVAGRLVATATAQRVGLRVMPTPSVGSSSTFASALVLERVCVPL